VIQVSNSDLQRAIEEAKSILQPLRQEDEYSGFAQPRPISAPEDAPGRQRHRHRRYHSSRCPLPEGQNRLQCHQSEERGHQGEGTGGKDIRCGLIRGGCQRLHGCHARMESAKGAVLSLLLDSYQKRDKIGIVAFRGCEAELILPPSSSVDLAPSRLKELPTGGKTPLSAGSPNS